MNEEFSETVEEVTRAVRETFKDSGLKASDVELLESVAVAIEGTAILAEVGGVTSKKLGEIVSMTLSIIYCRIKDVDK